MENLLKKTFYHVIDPADEIFCHNIKLCNGWIASASFLRAEDPSLGGVVSRYQALTTEQPKERVFERIRKENFQDCPSRLGAIFLFENLDLAEEANMIWWHGKRAVLSAKIIEARCIGRYDLKHLDASPQEWEDAAYKYWSGILTLKPVPEVLVNGIIQLYKWEQYAKSLIKETG